MIASTPLFGSHYVVDIIAGATLALAVALAIRRPWAVGVPKSQTGCRELDEAEIAG
jgi:membrane-associated phospholipid phosphatase